jgi:hypothetical protein
MFRLDVDKLSSIASLFDSMLAASDTKKSAGFTGSYAPAHLLRGYGLTSLYNFVVHSIFIFSITSGDLEIFLLRIT